MKRLLLSLVAAPMVVAFSQTPAVLIEACNSMQDFGKAPGVLEGGNGG